MNIQNISFKNRLALNYMLASALIMAVAFSLVYVVVRAAVIRNLDSDLAYEAGKHLSEVIVEDENIRFINKQEWTEREHTEVQVYPVFIQLMDENGQLMDKSPNLKSDTLPFHVQNNERQLDAHINRQAIRQVQLPIIQGGELKGYILAAVSSESSFSVIELLQNILIISYLVLLALLYIISRVLAGHSIMPVQKIAQSMYHIRSTNLNQRLALPPSKDEIYDLCVSFNELLERIENAMIREKQFTSDASHELRTPLATLQGTLEVLIRKPRQQHEYDEKVNYCLREIEKMTKLVEQLLLLARLEKSGQRELATTVPLVSLIEGALERQQYRIIAKRLSPEVSLEAACKLPPYFASLIIDNLISNAVKYAFEDTLLEITSVNTSAGVALRIKDAGIGIRPEDRAHIFESFFRSEALEHKHISGHGLGLSIVKKAVDALGASIEVESEYGVGTTVTVVFKEILR